MNGVDVVAILRIEQDKEEEFLTRTRTAQEENRITVSSLSNTHVLNERSSIDIVCEAPRLARNRLG